jgi:hypothetical protein
MSAFARPRIRNVFAIEIETELWLNKRVSDGSPLVFLSRFNIRTVGSLDSSLKTSLCICLLLMVLLGCDAESQPTAKPQTQHPAWTVSPAAKRKLVVATTSLSAGTPCAAVIAVLGKPDSDDQEIPKGGMTSHGRFLHYRLSTWEAGLSNTFYDESIDVDLDTSNAVRKILIHATLTD